MQIPPKIPILGIGISATSLAEMCAGLDEWGRARTGGYVCVCNVHTVMEAQDDPDYAAVLNAATVATPDGMPLVWALRRLGRPEQARVYGPDLLLAWAEYAAARPDAPPSYFYGGAPGVAAELARTLQTRFPGFRVAGAESPPFRDLTPAEDEAVLTRFAAAGAGLVWVGLGAPKQERWMRAHAEKTGAVLLGVGAAFDFLTGRVPQAPRWLMRLGLEWLFRLAMEPRRLWKRYFHHNPRFVWRLGRQLWEDKTQINS